MRVFGLLSCVFLCLTPVGQAIAASDSAPAAPIAAAVAKALRSTVEIKVANQAEISKGTGVVIQSTPTRDTVITACHVIDVASDPQILVTLPSGQSLKARSRGCLNNLDLATVTIPHQETMVAAEFAPTLISQTTFVIGNPIAGEFYVSPGFGTLQAREKIASVCPTCADGDSGGGVWNPGGQLLGILVEGGHIPGDRKNYELAYPVGTFAAAVSLR